MVARLGERRAARQQEEDEVRRLWEEKRAAADPHGDDEGQVGAQEEHGISPPQEDESQVLAAYDPREEESTDESPHQALHVPQDTLPVLERTSPINSPDPSHIAQAPVDDTLGVPDRPISRGTMRSEAFEYDNLRRSLSSRTARKEMGIVEPIPRVDQAHPEHGEEDIEEEVTNPSIHQALEEPLTLPRPAYATPSRHTPNASTSTEGTVQNYSPGESIGSRDALGSMMFVMGGSLAQNASAGRMGVDWPSEVEEHTGSDWGTPARDLHRTSS
jgi:hypothetical protein